MIRPSSVGLLACSRAAGAPPPWRGRIGGGLGGGGDNGGGRFEIDRFSNFTDDGSDDAESELRLRTQPSVAESVLAQVEALVVHEGRSVDEAARIVQHYYRNERRVGQRGGLLAVLVVRWSTYFVATEAEPPFRHKYAVRFARKGTSAVATAKGPAKASKTRQKGARPPSASGRAVHSASSWGSGCDEGRRSVPAQPSRARRRCVRMCTMAVGER